MSLHKVLQARLVDGSGFRLRVHVDSTHFVKRTCHFQLGRLKKLRDLGAEVYLCLGDKSDGVFHQKAAVSNKRFLWSGNGNFTAASRHKHDELLFKLAGLNVQKVLARLAQARARGKLWNGEL